MKVNWKRIFSLVLALCLCVGFMPVTARAAIVDHGTCGDSLTWTLDADGVLTITGTGMMQGYYYYDNALGDYVIGNAAWNKANPAVKRVVIGEGVTLVNVGAFCGCTQLTEVQLPSTLEHIGSYAFKDCTSLTEITIPASLKHLEPDAFQGCSSLAKINVHKDNEKFYTDDRGVLYSYEIDYSGMESHYLLLAPVSLSGEYEIFDGKIGFYAGAFENCTELTSVILPEGAHIREYLFSNCTSLTSITLPEGIFYVGSGAFKTAQP